MPSRLRDTSGHRRKAFLLAAFDKSLQVVAPKAQESVGLSKGRENIQLID